MLFVMMCSISWLQMHVRDIGLPVACCTMFGTVFVSLRLSTGGIFSNFQSYGTWPVSFFNYREFKSY